MKRTLSLILALAMIMSLFTTVSFAEEAAPKDLGAPTLAKNAVEYVGDTYPVKYENGTATVYYLGGAKPAAGVEVSGKSVRTSNPDKLEYYAEDGRNYYTIKLAYVDLSTKLTLKTVKADSNEWTHIDAANYYYTGATIDADKFYVNATLSDVKLTNSIASGGTLKVTAFEVDDASNNSMSELDYATPYKATPSAYYYSTGVTMNIPGSLEFKQAKVTPIASLLHATDAFTAVSMPSEMDAIKYYTQGEGTANVGKFICTDASGFTNGATKNVVLTGENGLKVIVPLKVSKSGNAVSLKITNGSSAEYTYKKGAALLNAIDAAISGVEIGADTVVNLTIPAAADWDSFAFYGKTSSATTQLTAGQSFAVNNSQSLVVKTIAGDIDDVKLPYTTKIGSNTYSGEITITADYAAKVTDKQAPLFFYEWSYLDSISGIKWLDETDAETTFSTTGSNPAVAGYNEVLKVDPNGKTSDWTWTYTGYDSNKVAKQVDITFSPVDYDILAYVEEGKSAFSFDAFELFAENVAEAQDVYYDVSVDHVEFDEVSGSKWTLKKGSKKISTADEFTSSTIGSVYLDVTVAGYYDIPFSVYFDYKEDKNDSWSKNATKYYQGLIRVYAGEDGDIKYEVSYGDSVNFKSADFAALYKKMAGSKKVLETVKVDVLPVYGTLYRNNKVATSYAVDAGDTFYYDPSSANSSYDLAKVVYWASKSNTAEYSVYIPVTMDGTGGEEVAVVEIVVNTGIPFTDIAKGSTFYDYIEYCYNNGIMGGKTTTKFDASSSITRAQLVTTLYRMAGSPATYNNKTLPFTDTTALSKEFSNAVKWAYYNKIVGGTSATTFAPNTAVTRQALVKILYGYATAYDLDYGMVIGSNLGYYTDGGTVSASMKDAMNWALDYGLLSGNGNKLNPRGSTTRGAAAKILANFHANFVV